MVKGIRLFLVVAILVALFLPSTVLADTCEWTMQTDNASVLERWYAARLNGSVSALSVSATKWGFVLDEYPHSNPGTAVPDSTAYSYSYIETETHSSPFNAYISALSMDGLLEPGLRPNTTYYFRFAVYFGGECEMWDYGDELTFVTAVLPTEGTHFYSYDIGDFIELEALEPDDSTHRATLYGEGPHGWMDAFAFVWGTESQDNPDGWPDYWHDVDPDDTSYEHYEAFYLDENPELFDDDSFELEIRDLIPGEHYYVRFALDTLMVGDWVYSEEIDFIADSSVCTRYEYFDWYVPDDYAEDPDPISADVWVGQRFIPDSTHTVDYISVRVGQLDVATYIYAYLYEGDEIDGYPQGDALASCSFTATTDEPLWVTTALDTEVTVTENQTYVLVLKGEDSHETVWASSSQDDTSGPGGYISNYGEGWNAGGRDALFEIWDCPNAAVLQPPEDFVAAPVTGGEAYLTWHQPNDFTLWPSAQTFIRMEQWEYPDDPPSTTDGSTLIYQASMGTEGGHSYTVYGLETGTTYYFRIWFENGGSFTDYDEDFCTPYSGTIPPSDVDIPDNWFLDPTCDSWDNVPMAMTIINGIYDKFGLPTTTVCLWVNLLLLSCAMTMSYSGVAAARQDMGGSTILVPFIVMCFGFIVGPFIGAFPGFFLAIGVIIGLGVAFAWARA